MVFEPINPEQILHFLRLQDARRIGNENGPLFVELNYLYRRCEYVNGVGYCVRVVLWHLPHAHGFSGRRYSGLSPWGAYPSEDPDLLLCVQNEVFKGIPRTFLGRSAFAASKLVKTVARTPPALAQRVHVDVDMCFSYIQLRANRMKNEGNFPDGFTLHLELGNVETCDQALLPFCELFKKGVASDQPAMSLKKQVKRLLLAMSNGSGVGNWLQNAGIHVSSEGLKDFENSQLLRTWPDLLHFYKSQNKWYPECSVTNALDERDERLGVDSLMQLAERVHDIPIASVEHDGVVFWFKPESYNKANLMAQVRRVFQGLAFAVKALRNPVELARELYPTRGDKRVSGLDSMTIGRWPSRQSGRTHSGRPAIPSHSFFGIFTATSSSRTPTT